MTNKQFIKKIAKAAKKHYKSFKILPSLTVAQAILESGWGGSLLAKQCHNYFGMKWVSGCGCGYKAYKTAEQSQNGVYYTVYAKFRKYSSLSKGIKGYYEFLQYPRYKNLKGVTEYKRACRLIAADGWATAHDYAQKLIQLIEQYKLFEYDKEVLSLYDKTDNERANSSAAAKVDKKESASRKFKKGQCVILNGCVYCNGDGSGGSIRYVNTKMWVVGLVSSEVYPYYIGLALKKGGTRMGWASPKDIVG